MAILAALVVNGAGSVQSWSSVEQLKHATGPSEKAALALVLLLHLISFALSLDSGCIAGTEIRLKAF